MLHINSLPDPVLERILARVFTPNETCLPSVCRKWHELAHTTCYVRFSESFCYDSDSDASSTNDETCVILDTNISNTTPTRCTRHILLTLLWPSNPVQFLEKALDILDTLYWPSVNTLSLSFVASCEDNDNDSDDKSVYPRMQSKTVWAAKEIARMLPGISRLNIRANTSDSLSESFVLQLAAIYGQQLQQLKCNMPLELSSLRFSANLQHLDLQLDPRMADALQVHAEALRTVSLSNVPVDFSLCRLIGQANKEISFDKLESLHLAYAGQRSKSTCSVVEPCTLRFPRLANLSIQNCPKDCRVLDSKLPQPMTNISLHGSFADIQKTNISQIAVHTLSVTITHMNHASMSEFYETSNRIFSNPEIFQAKLQLSRSRLDLEPSKIAWTNITHLAMGDAVEFSNFLLLITALPRAVKLDIAEITLQNHPYEILNETDDSIKPFKSRIEDLRMYINTEMYPTPLPAIEYVVLRIHSLRRVRLSKDAVLPARVIAKLLEPNYPHLVELVIDNAY